MEGRKVMMEGGREKIKSEGGREGSSHFYNFAGSHSTARLSKGGVYKSVKHQQVNYNSRYCT